MGKSNRVVLDGTGFTPHEILALSKAAPGEAVTKARTDAKAGFQPIDLLVRIRGDIEIGARERVPDKFDGAKYLVAALAALSPEQRKKVLARPVVKREVRAVVEAELDVVKSRLPKHQGPAKLTPHLQVSKVVNGGS